MSSSNLPYARHHNFSVQIVEYSCHTDKYCEYYIEHLWNSFILNFCSIYLGLLFPVLMYIRDTHIRCLPKIKINLWHFCYYSRNSVQKGMRFMCYLNTHSAVFCFLYWSEMRLPAPRDLICPEALPSTGAGPLFTITHGSFYIITLSVGKKSCPSRLVLLGCLQSSLQCCQIPTDVCFYLNFFVLNKKEQQWLFV